MTTKVTVPIMNLCDVAAVDPADLMMPMRHLINDGRGLALLRGLSDRDLRDLDGVIWQQFADQPHIRLAVALRFRALISVFAAKRLKSMVLDHGFKSIAIAIELASTQRLNTRFGFKAHVFALALDTHARDAAPSVATQWPTLRPQEQIAA